MNDTPHQWIVWVLLGTLCNKFQSYETLRCQLLSLDLEWGVYSALL